MKAATNPRRQQAIENVGNCLYRSSLTNLYYSIFERAGRQVKRSLNTTNAHGCADEHDIRVSVNLHGNLSFIDYQGMPVLPIDIGCVCVRQSGVRHWLLALFIHAT